MAATPFKPISWAPNQPITSEKLNAMVTNDTYLRNNMVRGHYSNAGVHRTEGVKIMGGMVPFAPTKALHSRRYVSFANFFSASCKPIVTTGLISISTKMAFVSADGPGGAKVPTRDGCEISVIPFAYKPKNRKIDVTLYVAWHALGY